MKTIVASLVLLTIVNAHANAQQKMSPDNARRWTISVAAGAAIPVGKFGTKDIWDSTAMFAKTGPVLDISGSYRFALHWGAVVLVAGQEHTVDAQAASGQLSKADADPYDKYLYKSGKWEPWRILGGVSWSLPIGTDHHFSINARALAGAVKVTVPQRSRSEESIDTSGTGGLSFSTAGIYKSSLSWQFAYQAGIGARYDFGQRYFVLAGVDYAGSLLHISSPPLILASPEYPPGPVQVIAISGTPPPPPVYHKPSPYTQPMATLNVSLGFGVRI